MSDPREHELLEEIRVRDTRIKERDAQISKLSEELRRAQLEIELLKQKLDLVLRRFFGKKSEQLDPNQLQLLLEKTFSPGPAAGKESGPDATEALPPVPKKAAPHPAPERKPRLPEHLPVVEETIVPLQVQAAPEQWNKMGEEITERLDYTPGRFVRLRTIRPKYVPRTVSDEARPVIAALPPCILERSILTPGLLAQILVAKYCDHLPLYRQEWIYSSRHGVEISRQSLAQWVAVGADWLLLIFEQIRAEVMSGDYVQIDETPVRYLVPGHGKTKLGYLWVCHRPGADTVYSWHTSRAAACLEKIVPADFSGRIQCDGYQGYDAFADGRKEIELSGLLGACAAEVLRCICGTKLQGIGADPASAAEPLRDGSKTARRTRRPQRTSADPGTRKPPGDQTNPSPPRALE
jgi:transposase